MEKTQKAFNLLVDKPSKADKIQAHQEVVIKEVTVADITALIQTIPQRKTLQKQKATKTEIYTNKNRKYARH